MASASTLGASDVTIPSKYYEPSRITITIVLRVDRRAQEKSALALMKVDRSALDAVIGVFYSMPVDNVSRPQT